MDMDFHYHATYVAALLAGYDESEATTIAHAGEYVDDSDNNRLIDKDKLGLIPMATALPFWSLITMGRTSDWSDATIAHDRRMWTAFHFIPGNLDHTYNYEGRTREQAVFDKFEYNLLAQEQFRSMCLPDSPLAIAMVNDTIANHADDLHMIGIRMHVLIDTFAHMLFCGSAAWHVNDVNALPEMLVDGEWVPMLIPVFATQEIYYNSLSYTGHGRMGHIPDYPWITYRYKPQWSATTIVKDNPKMYRRAFQEMVKAMSCIRNKQMYAPPKESEFLSNDDADKALLEEITKIITKTEDHYYNLQDYTDERCQNWIDALPALRKHSGKSLPNPADYNPDKWMEEANHSQSIKDTHYYKFHQAAHKHLSFIRNELGGKGLSLLGSLSFATKEDLTGVIGKNVRIKRAGAGSNPCYWEVENSSTEEGTPIQLWTSGDKNENYNLWQIRYVKTTPHGDDVFAIVNPKLERVASVKGDRLEAYKDHAHASELAMGNSHALSQVFKIIKHTGTHKPTSYTFHRGDSDQDLISENGNLGNSTKIILNASGGDHLEWGRWELDFI